MPTYLAILDMHSLKQSKIVEYKGQSVRPKVSYQPFHLDRPIDREDRRWDIPKAKKLHRLGDRADFGRHRAW